MTRWTCNKCRVGHVVKKPHAQSERLRCPDCRLKFWAAMRNGRGTCQVGITPEEYAKVTA